ncbi:hypothetical protein WMF31_18820 [Sorangium sp. So ce1036]|uniref:hypothetical protein n=1 Tax=Sorangium sp. So ce1036 TaxID=3133328 RepID=UPI003F044550
MTRQELLALVALGLFGAACGSDPGFEGAKAPRLEAKRNADGTIDDRSMCDWKGREDREASETAGPGAIQPNVRRVFQIVGTGEDRHRALVCREIDTNFDGVKDVVRRYNEKGESLHEEADSNYDGRIDTWITFATGRLAEVRIDSDRDGNPDEWKYYSGGKLSRIKRDTNRDGKPDVWEIYRMGRLERMGVDLDGDERVDRWDHDNELRRRVEDAERKKEEEAAAEAAKKAAEDQAAADEANEAVDSGGSAEPPKE